MKAYLRLFGFLIVLFLALFAVVEWLQIPLLIDPSDQMSDAQIGTAMLGVGLLIGDVFLPVPSSLIMVAHGALFGTVGGTLLSLIGGTGATIVGFGIGRANSDAINRRVSPQDQTRAAALFQRWGAIAVLVSRPIPILAEAVAIMAGTSSMAWSTLILSSIAGTAPAAFLYALTGATAAHLDNFLLTFALVMAIAGAWWVISQKMFEQQAKEA